MPESYSVEIRRFSAPRLLYAGVLSWRKGWRRRACMDQIEGPWGTGEGKDAVRGLITMAESTGGARRTVR